MDALDKVKSYLFPYETHKYITSITVEELKKRLHKDLEPKQFIRFNRGIFGNKNHKKYEGEIKENGFAIYRILRYKNSFAPAIIGDFEKSLNEKTTVHITMRPRYFPMIFVIVWFSFFGFSAINQISNGDSYFSLLVFLFIYVLITAGFKYESHKSKKFLKNLIMPEDTNDSNSWIIRN